MNGIARTCSIAVLATLALAPAAGAQVLDGAFDDVSRVASAADSRAARPPACEASGAELRERLGLLWTAICRARDLIWEGCQDSNKHHFLNHGYRPYEAAWNVDGHLLATGHLLVNSSRGRGSASRRNHDFAFDRELFRRFEDPMVYLRSFRGKTRPVYDRLLALYETELKRIRDLRISGSEAEWTQVPARAHKAILTVEARTRLLQEYVNAVRAQGAELTVTDGDVASFRKILEFTRHSLGVSDDGATVDLERAESAFELVQKGSVVLSRTPHCYQLKKDLAKRLRRDAGLEGLTIGGSDNRLPPLKRLPWTVVDKLFGGVMIPAGFPLLENRSASFRQSLGPRIFLVHAGASALLEWFNGASSSRAD